MKKRIFSAIILAVVCVLSSFVFACKKNVVFTFEANGGNAVADMTVPANQETTLPETTRSGFTFDGWYLNADFSGGAVKSYKTDKNTTFYAKWSVAEQYATITLDAAGGTLSTAKVEGRVGAKIADLVKNITPTKTVAAGGANVRFAGWYNGNRPLSDSATLTASGVTLTARYEYEYKLIVRIKNADGGYEENAEYSRSGYAQEGTTITAPDFSKNGFSFDKSDKTMVVKTTAAENTFTLDYSRRNLTITFDKNLPDGSSSTDIRETVLSGDELVLPSVDDECAGYIFVGWSKTETGNLEYPVDVISSKLYPVAGETTESKFTPDKTMTLYGVWTKGHVDMFGGADVIYSFDKEDEDGMTEKVVYLYRGGYFFEGMYAEDSDAYGFRVSASTVYTAYFIDDLYFAYRDDSRTQSYIEYSISFESGRLGTKVDDTTTIEIDAASKVTYKKNGEVVSTGSLLLENGTYTATFTDGSTMSFIVGTIGSGTNARHVFQRRNEEEYGKKLLRYIVSANTLTAVEEARGYYLQLNGYGVAYMVTSSQTQGFYYNYNNGFIELYSSRGVLAGTFKLMNELVDDNGNAIAGYMYYDKDLNHEFTNGNDVLKLDGAYKAEYHENGQRYQGKFVQSSSSSLGGTLVFFTSDSGKSATFVLYSERQADKTYKYTYKTVNNNYTEYKYVQGSLIYKNRIIVLNETADDDMTIYAATKSGTFVKVASGKYKKDGDKYTFYGITAYAAEDLYELDDFSNDFSNISEIEFMISSDYGVIYWTKVTAKDSQTDDKGTIYNNKNGEGELIIFGNKTETNDGVTTTAVGAFAIYTAADGTVYTGLFGDNDTFYYLAYTITVNEKTVKRYFFFDLDHENTTYEVYQYAPYTAYAVAENGTLNAREYIKADGKGGVTYVTVTVTEEDGESKRVENPENGRLERTEETVGGVSAYNFIGEKGTTFTMISFVSGNYYVFAKKSELAATGTYTAADGAELTLDGYILATYVTADNKRLSNVFYFKTDVENQVVLVYSSNSSTYALYFDLNEADKSFTMRSSEYGSYMRLDNQGISGMRFELDGYGSIADYGNVAHAIVRDYERNADGSFKYDDDNKLIQIVVDENAYYKIDVENGKTYIFVKYTALNGDVVELKGLITSVTSNKQTIPAIVEVHTEVEQTYVNPSDWSVLVLTSYGVATRIDGKSGVALAGNYTIIALDEESGNGLLYFSAGESSAVYRYNTKSREAYERRFDEQGYYTEDLSALFFSAYGYATYAKGSSSTTYFYDVDDEGNITVYHQDWYAAEHDEKYGFVKEEFGKHANTKTFNGDTYLAASGRDIDFEKADAELQKFPVQYDTNTKVYFGNITFRPTGRDTFSSSATIDLYKEDGTRLTDKDGNGVVFSATVKREWKDEKQTAKRTYIEISLSGGSKYEFDIDFVYGGTSGSTYKITTMKWSISGSGYFYNVGMMNLYIQAMRGQDVSSMIEEVKKLNYGSIGFTRIYNEQGEIETESVEASFTENCLLKGADGKLWTIEGSTPEFVPEDTANNTIAHTNMKAEGAEGTVFKALGAGYKINLVDAGGNKYTAVIAYQSMSSVGFSGYGFYFAAINAVSEHEVTDQNGNAYKITADRVIATENTSAVQLGSIYYDVTLTDKDGNVIKGTNYFYGKDENGDNDYTKLWFVARTVEDGKVLSTKAYELAFTGGTTVDGGYTPFETATVKSYDLKVAYSATGKAFVEYTEENGVKTVMFYTTIDVYTITNQIKACAYDADTDTCVITMYDDTQYNVEFITGDDGTVTVNLSTK